MNIKLIKLTSGEDIVAEVIFEEDTNNISLKNVNTANQTMGVISTPKAGGMVPLMARRSGSVGQTTTLYGNSLRFDFGYQEMTTRQSCKNDKISYDIDLRMIEKDKSTFTESISIITMNIIRTIAKENRFRNGPRI